MKFIINKTTLEKSNFIQNGQPVIVCLFQDNVKTNRTDAMTYPSVQSFINDQKLTRNMDQQKIYDAKIKALSDQYYNEILVNGINVNGIVLAATEYDQNAFGRMLTMFKLAEDHMPEQRYIDEFQDSIETIADKDLRPHNLTVREIKQILLQYGFQLTQLWSNFANKRALIL